MAPTLTELGADAKAALALAAELGFRHVQLNAAQPGLRPRELDGSARRGLLATMRRLELAVAGVDLWIPPAHFADPAHVDRAVGAVCAAVELAADLGRVPLSLALPPAGAPRSASDEAQPAADPIEPLVATMLDCAHRHDVALADHSTGGAAREGTAIGIDPAVWLAQGQDPSAAVLRAGERLAAARLCDLLSSGVRGPIGQQGQGRLDVQAFAIAIAVVGFRRPVVLDARQWLDPIQGMRQSAQAWVAAT